MPDRFLVGRLEIVDVQHLAGAGCFGKARQQSLLLGQRHVLVFATAIRPRLERLDAAVVIGHVRAVHRAQRRAHCRRNSGLRHSALTQQHHLDALALRSRYLPSQRSFQPPHLGFAAFDHLLAPNQMAKANHTSAEENNSPSSLRRLPTKNLSIQAVLEVVLGTVARTMPQLGLLFMLVFLPMNLLSGSNTPLESMPPWLAMVMQASPSTHFVSFAQSILYRGAGLGVVWPQ